MRNKNLLSLQNILDNCADTYADLRDMQVELEYMLDNGHPYDQLMEVVIPFNEKLSHYANATEALIEHFKVFKYNILKFPGFNGLLELDSVSLKNNMNIILQSHTSAEYVSTSLKDLIIIPYQQSSAENMHILTHMVSLIDTVHNDKSYVVVQELLRCIAFIFEKTGPLDRVLSAMGI